MVTDNEYAEVLGMTEKDHQKIKEGQAEVFQGKPTHVFSTYKNSKGEERERLDRVIAHHFNLKTEEQKRTEAVSDSAKSAATSARTAADALAEAKKHRIAAYIAAGIAAAAALVTVLTAVWG